MRRVSEGYFRTIPTAPHKPDPRHWRDDQLTLSWLGHATVLVNFFGVWILTDPALSARVGVRVGPLTFGPKRYVAAALRTSELPPLHFIQDQEGQAARASHGGGIIPQGSEIYSDRRFHARIRYMGKAESEGTA